MKNIFTLSLFLFVGILYAQTDKEIAASLITKEKIEGHIYFLASDELKGRATGSDEIKIASQYLANMLRSYGAKPVPGANGYFQEVPFTKTTAATSRSLSINGTVQTTPPIPVGGKNINYEGDAVYLNYGLEEDYKGKDVKGKLVFIKAGSATATHPQQMFEMIEEKRDIAKKHGARAVVELANINPMIWEFIEHALGEDRMTLKDDKEEVNDFNYIWMIDPNDQIAQSLVAKRKNISKLTISGIEEKTVICRNVVAMIEGTDPKLKEEYIIYSGHYDHVGIGTPDATGDSIYNGARDNAVGTTTVLSMAENLAKHPTKRSALFILYTGEEIGLHGSRYYVENPLIPLEQMVFCFNSDNAGYNDTSLITIFGLGRTTAENDIKVAASAFGLTAIDDPAPEENLFERSDNINFAMKGIPAPTFSMGFTSFSGQVTETYHKPSDKAETIDYDYLVKFFKSYVLAGRLIANNPKTPFWTSGDKFEAAGKELYGR
jgi:aminopeptidase YwaD